MNFYSMTDKGIEAELGGRIRSLRLRRNLTQQEVAEAAALSLNTIKALEAGKGKLSSLIAVLRELEALDELDNLIPETLISPLQLAKQQGKVRKRASGKRVKESKQEEAEW
ncbi:MAG: helix-turn-helix domain-containing protein [Deltaproteobacteria bacterium]|nr:helix-turn-helix domain-containing protein [Deltaproteobacteria bacterium]